MRNFYDSNYPIGVTDAHPYFTDDDLRVLDATVYCSNCAWSGDDDQLTVGVLVVDGGEVLQPERCGVCRDQRLVSIGDKQ